MTEDKVTRYKHGRYECIEILEDLLQELDGFEGFLIGNVIKYLWRWKYKGGIRDIEKAEDYLCKLAMYEDDKEKMFELASEAVAKVREVTADANT